MIITFILYTLFIISIASYFLAPEAYSNQFCTGMFFLYLISFFLFFIKYKKNFPSLFNFHFLFFLSYLLVNFIYPVFLYPVNREAFFMFRYPFDDNLINSSTALAQIGAICYILGAIFAGKLKYNKEKQLTCKYSSKLLFFVNNFTLFLSICFFLYVIMILFKTDAVEVESRLLLFVKIFIILTCIYNTISHKDLMQKKQRIFL